MVFDSRAPVGSGQAVYFTGVAAEVTGDDLDAGTWRSYELAAAPIEACGSGPWPTSSRRSPTGSTVQGPCSPG